MSEEIRIQAKVSLWQEYIVKIPDGMTKEEFVKELKENDPGANHYENNGIDILFETEELIGVEYYDDDSNLIDSIKLPKGERILYWG